MGRAWGAARGRQGGPWGPPAEAVPPCVQAAGKGAEAVWPEGQGQGLHPPRPGFDGDVVAMMVHIYMLYVYVVCNATSLKRGRGYQSHSINSNPSVAGQNSFSRPSNEPSCTAFARASLGPSGPHWPGAPWPRPMTQRSRSWASVRRERPLPPRMPRSQRNGRSGRRLRRPWPGGPSSGLPRAFFARTTPAAAQKAAAAHAQLQADLALCRR